MKKRHVKREFIPEWFNSEIQAAIATRNHLHRKAVMTNNASNWCEYRSARNRVVDLIRNHAKRSFYRNSINNNLENPKNLWRIIRSLAPSKCSKLPNHLTIDGRNYHDYYDIANLFNEHFANISSSVQLNHVSDPPKWECIADYGLTVVCETKWDETKWKSVVCEMEICTLRNGNLYFAK